MMRKAWGWRFSGLPSGRHWAAPALLVQPVVVFGLALIALIWFGAQALIDQHRSAAHDDALGDVRNVAVMLDREISVTVGELDRILQFVRSTHQQNPTLAWSSVFASGYWADDRMIQISVTDANGIVVASSASLASAGRVDLSDREHFRVQRDARDDRLFISKPLVGRVTGKPSVQFSRRLSDAIGAFAGIIVVSLDPALLGRVYTEAKFGPGFAFALVGDDGVVRSGAGDFADLLGKTMPGGDKLAKFYTQDVGSLVFVDTDERIEIIRCIEGFPLNIVVSSPGVAANALFARSAAHYRWIASLGSLFVLLATASAALSRQRYERRILDLAKTDALTGLPNRLQFRQELKALFELPADERNFAVHIVDLDSFKFVNDTYGHLVGDELLKVVAARLASVANHGEIVGRLGGDEFAILQPVRAVSEDAVRLAQRVIDGLRQPFRIGDVDISISASLGTASARHDGANASELLQAADLALYSAKTSGRGAANCYHEAMLHRLRQRVAVEAGLRQALENHEFELYYQPIVSLLTNRTVAMETLLRWNRPGHGLVGPAEFIGVAEETGLIAPIGEWVMKQACADIAELDEDLRVAVNCSPRQFAGGGIAPVIRAALAASGLDPARLEIEITESMLLKEDRHVTRQLEEVRDLGVHISLDDFGTGYSSLSYLESYPIDRMKIDRAFVTPLGERRQSQALVQAIIDLGAALGIAIIAEGVETAEQLQKLRALGCHEAQGYLFSKPKPFAAFVDAAARRFAALAA